jgi:hypothetical protein
VRVIHVAEGAEGHLVQIAWIAVVVDHHDEFGEAQQVRAPDRVHHLVRVFGIALLDRDDEAVVEHTRFRHMHVDDVGYQDADEGQEDALCRVPDRPVLLRRLARDDRVIDRRLPHGHAFHMQHRKRLDRRVEAGVVTERAFRRAFARFHIALDDHLRVGGYLQRHRQAVDQLDPFAPKEAREEVFVDIAGQRRARGVGHHRVGTEGYRDREALAEPFGDGVVGGRVLVDLPMHPELGLGVLLQPIESQVAFAGLGMFGVRQPIGVEDAAVPGPRHQDRATGRGRHRTLSARPLGTAPASPA